jgi:hypothetical protein
MLSNPFGSLGPLNATSFAQTIATPVVEKSPPTEETKEPEQMNTS